MTIQPLIEKLDRLETSMRGWEVLSGVLVNQGVDKVGDWNMQTWSHSLDGAFSVAALERVRLDEKPLSFRSYDRRLWLLCSRGRLRVDFANDQKSVLSEGGYLVVSPHVSHAIFPLTRICVAVLVTIPADPGLQNEEG